MQITRRAFMKGGAMAVVGTAAIPAFLARAVYAQSAAAKAQSKRLVVVFQRGAVDGLSMVVPYREQVYYQLRPAISIPQQQVIDLDGFFGLHPAMQPLKPLWERRELAIIHASGSPDGTRSHFDAQDYMESGTPGVKSTQDGWLNRALSASREKDASAFRAIALGTQVPRTLEGKFPALAIDNVRNFAVGGQNPAGVRMSEDFQALYSDSTDAVLHGTGAETFEAVKMLKATDPANYTPAPGAVYPGGPFGSSLRQIAQLLKANLGVEAAFADVGGWDTHHSQGNAQGQLANNLRQFSESLAAFWTDMGDEAENIVLVTMSEFGRTVHENGTGGTDHGHANVMLVMGGPVRGGKVYGKWPGMAPEQLYQSRDLAVTTDFRRVLAEASASTLCPANLHSVFPGTSFHASDFLGLLKV